MSYSDVDKAVLKVKVQELISEHVGDKVDLAFTTELYQLLAPVLHPDGGLSAEKKTHSIEVLPDGRWSLHYVTDGAGRYTYAEACLAMSSYHYREADDWNDRAQ